MLLQRIALLVRFRVQPGAGSAADCGILADVGVADQALRDRLASTPLTVASARVTSSRETPTLKLPVISLPQTKRLAGRRVPAQ